MVCWLFFLPAFLAVLTNLMEEIGKSSILLSYPVPFFENLLHEAKHLQTNLRSDYLRSPQPYKFHSTNHRHHHFICRFW